MKLTYTKHGDYYLPNLDIPAQEKVPVNRYGQMHGDYLKKNNQTTYNELLFSGRLNRYLAELGEQAEKMLALLMEQYAAAENVTEEMKAADQMGWPTRWIRWILPTRIMKCAMTICRLDRIISIMRSEPPERSCRSWRSAFIISESRK